MNYFLKSYGCQYNEWDAARIGYLFNKLGWQESNEKEADVVFVVACAVRQTAVDRMIGKIKNWQEGGKKVIVSGCILDADKKKFEKNNILIWDNTKPELLKDILNIPEVTNNSTIEQFNNEGRTSSAYLPIMIGCNNFCTYCAVPYTRGRETSRPMTEVIGDFKRLVAKGFKEITLLGQNVNSYNPNVIPAKAGIQANSHPELVSGSHNTQNNIRPFTALLTALNDIPGDFIISFTSNHPKDMTDDIIEAVRDLPKVKKEIHLPLQSGSNKILKAMNRPYTKEEYLALADKIKKMIPGVQILTDSIVGFPGETEEDFQETVDVFRKVNYHIAYNNKYSPRKGTVAFKLGDPIPWQEKERRWRILNDISYYKK